MFPFSIARENAIEELAPPPDSGGGLFDRAPSLRESGEMAVASIVKSLQTMAGPSTTIEGMLAGFTSSTPRDVVIGHRPDAVIGSIVVKDLGCLMLVSLDGTLVHALVELLCGGNGIEPQAVEPRPVTPIDQQFAQIVFSLAAVAVQTEWADYGFSSAQAARIEGVLAPDILGARVEEVGILAITIGIFGLHGTLSLILPPAALNRFGGDMPSIAMPTTSDPLWTSQLQREISRASVALSAFLEAKDIPLGALAGLQVGQILPLPADARSRAMLVSEGSILCRGEIGRDETHYSLRIDEFVRESVNIARMAPHRAPYPDVSKG
jgi:flagellar motor switch protein FliM